MQQRYFHFFVTLLLLQGFIVKAQQPLYTEYRPDETASKIFSLYKIKTGYLLAGTGNGLYKFDGINFIKIESGKPALTDTVTAIFQDNRNTIWAGCNSGRIAKLVNNRLQYIDPEEGLPKKKITCFAQDSRGDIWFGTAGEGLYHFYNKKLYLVNEENGLSDLNVHTIAVTKNNEIIAATDQGINSCQFDGTKTAVTVTGPAQGLPDYIVTAIASAGNNNFWVGLQEKGFCQYNHSTKKITVPSTSAHWDKGQVSSLHFAHGRLWMLTHDSGLVCYAAGGQQLLPIAAGCKKGNALTEDNQGNMWLLTESSSLVKAASNMVQLHPLYNEPFVATVHAIAVDRQGNYWAGTGMALMRYHYDGNTYVSKKFLIAGLDAKTDITSLYQDIYDNIWIGTMGKGVFVLDTRTGKTRQVKEMSASSNILSITGTGTSICIAGLEGAVIVALNDNNTVIDNIYAYTSYNRIETIGSTYIYNVFKDSKGRIWFATDGKGLTMLQDGIYKHYNKASGIQDEHIYSVTEDHRGKIWFSTANAGVYAFDGKLFTNYSVKEGLTSAAASAVKIDRLGNIVVVHKQGLDVISAGNGSVTYINALSGVTGINDDLGAACVNAAGNVFVATHKGIAEYTAMEGSNNMPATVIENVQLFLNDIDTGSTHSFKYDENNIQFNFTGLYYTDPEHVFYEFKLEGLYNSWQFTTDNSKAFPKLPPGQYVFRVRSSLNKNFSHASEAAFAFEIVKPFWRTAWFAAGIILLTAGLLYWYVKRRERHLTHVQELKNEKVKFEFEVLRNQVNPHFLFNSFNTLISTIEDDPKTGVEYVEHLSDFFRNIVNYRDVNIISLKEEIAMLENYLYLQQKRYGSSLQLRISIDTRRSEQVFLPPLTLQLLVENAIKHNVVSKEAILQITVTEQEGFLVVQNNINKKISKEKGTGMGLENIKNRYALLDDKPVEVKETAENFIVNLPILKK